MSGSFNPPASPTDGQIYSFGGATWVWSASKGVWQNANTGANFMPIGGGSFTGPVVLAADAPPSTPLAPTTLQQMNTAVGHNVGRNLLHNGLFNIQQRAAGPWTTNAAYTLDRWLMFAVSDTVSVSAQVLADADRTAIGDESAQNVIQVVFTGSSTANAQTALGQRIEDARRTSNKSVTGSFWARATSGTPRVGLAAYQFFGAGGSPSAPVITGLGATTALSSTWTRYTISGTVPSVIGKTFGTTAATSYMQCSLILSDQANQYGTGVGVQSGTVQFWGEQLEIVAAVTTPPTVTPLEKLDPETDLAHCQRFAVGTYVDCNSVPAAGGQIVSAMAFFPVSMRAPPTITFSNIQAGNASGLAVYSYQQSGMKAGVTATSAGALNFSASVFASADL